MCGPLKNRVIKYKLVVFLHDDDKNKGIKVNNMWVPHTKTLKVEIFDKCSN